MKISILIPVYNEEQTILKALEDLSNLKFKILQKEIIVIDDGSTDKTNQILISSKHLYDKMFVNKYNQGKVSAVKLGLQNSTGNYIVFHDADLEYDPLDLLKFENVFLRFNADGVVGSRFRYDQYTRSHSILNRLGNFILTFTFNILYNTTFTDIYSCYFAFKKNLLKSENLNVEGFAQHAEILCNVIKNGKKFYEVPINYNGRNAAEGKKIKFYHFFPVLFEIFLGKFK